MKIETNQTKQTNIFNQKKKMLKVLSGIRDSRNVAMKNPIILLLSKYSTYINGIFSSLPPLSSLLTKMINQTLTCIMCTHTKA